MGLYGLLSFVGVGVGILELNSPLLVVLLFFWDFVFWGFCFLGEMGNVGGERILGIFFSGG